MIIFVLKKFFVIFLYLGISYLRWADVYMTKSTLEGHETKEVWRWSMWILEHIENLAVGQKTIAFIYRSIIWKCLLAFTVFRCCLSAAFQLFICTRGENIPRTCCTFVYMISGFRGGHSASCFRWRFLAQERFLNLAVCKTCCWQKRCLLSSAQWISQAKSDVWDFTFRVTWGSPGQGMSRYLQSTLATAGTVQKLGEAGPRTDNRNKGQNAELLC